MGCVNDPATLGPSNSNNVSNQPNPEAFRAANSLDKKAGAHEENKNSQDIHQSLTETANIRRNIKPKKTPQAGQALEDFTSRLFRENDKENKGYLTLTQFRSILKEYIADDLTEREIRESRKIVDDNNNKKVEKNELLQLFEIYYKK